MNIQTRTLAESDADAELWAERCQYWQAAHEASISIRKRRERQSAPLMLTGHGLSIRVDRGALMIKDGLTHFPQDKREHRFFKGGLDIPPRIVIVDGNGEITLDALDWLDSQDTPLIRLRWDGRIQSIMGKPRYASDPEKSHGRDRHARLKRRAPHSGRT